MQVFIEILGRDSGVVMQHFNFISRLFLAALMLSAQSTAQTPRAHNKDGTIALRLTTDLEVPIISIDTEVMWRTGGVVGDLTHADFIVSENDVRQEVYAWDHLPKLLSLLIVVDTATSGPDIHIVDDQPRK